MLRVCDQLVDPRLERVAAHAVERAEIADMLAPCEARIEAAHVGQHADAALHPAPVEMRIDAVDQGIAPVGGEHGVDEAQDGGLAGAVGADDAGDLAVARNEADAADGMDAAERLVKVANLDHSP